MTKQRFQDQIYFLASANKISIKSSYDCHDVMSVCHDSENTEHFEQHALCLQSHLELQLQTRISRKISGDYATILVEIPLKLCSSSKGISRRRICQFLVGVYHVMKSAELGRGSVAMIKSRNPSSQHGLSGSPHPLNLLHVPTSLIVMAGILMLMNACLKQEHSLTCSLRCLFC